MATSAQNINDLTMSASSCSPPPRKKVCSAVHQSTLHNFFQPLTPAKGSQSQVKVIKRTPKSLGLHVYSIEDITKATGLDKAYKTFWNEQITDIFNDPAMSNRLQDKEMIQGAINISWVLHKTSCLEVLCQEVEVLANKLFPLDTCRQNELLSTVQKHMKKVRELTDVCLAKQDADESEQEDVSGILKDLKRAQSSLKKALDRKKTELEHALKPQPLVVEQPQMLTEGEIHDLAQDILIEENIHFVELDS